MTDTQHTASGSNEKVNFTARIFSNKGLVKKQFPTFYEMYAYNNVDYIIMM